MRGYTPCGPPVTVALHPPLPKDHWGLQSLEATTVSSAEYLTSMITQIWAPRPFSLPLWRSPMFPFRNGEHSGLRTCSHRKQREQPSSSGQGTQSEGQRQGRTHLTCQEHPSSTTKHSTLSSQKQGGGGGSSSRDSGGRAER